jgi:hypothetical protein
MAKRENVSVPLPPPLDQRALVVRDQGLSNR